MISKKSVTITYRYTVGTTNPWYEFIKERKENGKEVLFALEVNAMRHEFLNTPAVEDYERARNNNFDDFSIKMISETDICYTYEATFYSSNYYC